MTLTELPTVTNMPTTVGPPVSCYNYTLVQGSSTCEFHLTIPEASITDDYNCNWTGEMKTADITCTVTANGEIFGSQGVQTTVVPHTVIEDSSLIAPMVVVTTQESGKATGTGSRSGGASPKTSTSTGLAAGGPLQTASCAVGWVGGAAALVVAMAL